MNSSGHLRLVATSTPRSRQAGGTVLGFLLGMLFGLAVALGVAVYITKVPLPFMNKAQPRPAGEAAEPKKDWDPNAGLPGRTAKPESAAVPSAAEPASPTAPAAPAAPAVSAAPAAPQGKGADPLGDLARARTEPSAPPAPAVVGNPPAASSSEPFQYFVQAGAYRTPEDAEQQRAKLSLMGMQSKVSERDQAGRMVYRVRLGPFERREDADKARERLSGNGVEAVVVRLQR